MVSRGRVETSTSGKAARGGCWRPLVEAVFRCGEVARESNAAANRHRCSLLQLVLVAHPQLSRGPEPLRPGPPAWRYCSVSWPAGHRSKVSSSGPSVHRRSGCTAPRSRPQQLSPTSVGLAACAGFTLPSRCSHGRSCNTLGILLFVGLALYSLLQQQRESSL